jgi:hypothetical protein
MRPLENLSQILKIVTNSIIISPEAPSMTYSIQNLLHFSFQSLYHLPAEAPSMTYSIQDLLHFSFQSLYHLPRTFKKSLRLKCERKQCDWEHLTSKRHRKGAPSRFFICLPSTSIAVLQMEIH